MCFCLGTCDQNHLGINISTVIAGWGGEEKDKEQNQRPWVNDPSSSLARSYQSRIRKQNQNRKPAEPG